MVRLFCAIVGRGEVFSVRVEKTKWDDENEYLVEDLTEAIKAQSGGRITAPSREQRLFLAKKDERWLNWAGLATVALDGDGCPKDFEKMNPTLNVRNSAVFGEDFKPGEDEIHVLVVVSTELTDRDEPRDSSREWLEEFFNEKVEFDSLPCVGSLASFVARALPVKIRAKKKWLEQWRLNSKLQEKMFVIDDAAPCVEFKGLIFNRRALTQLRRWQTKNSYIFVWDSVFRNVLDYVFTLARMDRGSCNNSSTRMKRPDFFFVLDHVFVFRGEEKAPEVNINVATKELREKIVWVYGNVPYVFGYAASGYRIDLCALHQEDGVVKSARIGSFNLEFKEDVFEVVLAILNLSLLFPAIVEACPASGQDEYKDITRSSGVVVRLYPAFVEKVYPSTSGLDRLMQLYFRMEQAGVSNVDRLIQVRLQKNSLVFEPRGTTWVFIVWDGFIVISAGLNVLRKREGGSWFLIDFADAAVSPQRSPSGQHLSVEEHAPEIFEAHGVHTTAVDIWAVGYLMESSDVIWLDFAERSSFYERLMAKDPTARPSAEEALATVRALEEEAKRKQEADRELQQGGNARQTPAQTRKRKYLAFHNES